MVCSRSVLAGVFDGLSQPAYAVTHFQGHGYMGKVVGIGGLFFRAKDPKALAAWYEQHLGIADINKAVWQQEAGPTVFAPFSHNTDYFDRPDQQWMVNFRVDDLDAMIAQLNASGIAVETRAEWDSQVGRFARIHDPEGNPIELWEPAKDRG